MFAHFSLHKLLLKALKDLDYSQATSVQAEAIPLALEGLDLQVNSETGSGKTAAYLLPTLHRLLTTANREAGVRALILVPTRELAKQVYANCHALMKHSNLSAGLVRGGDDFECQVALLQEQPAVVVATTGRLMEHLAQGFVDLSDLDVLVLDEADRMLDMGFSDDVLTIAEACNSERQTLLFSATLNHKWLPSVAKKVLREPEVLNVSGGRVGHDDIHEQVILADDDKHKLNLLLWLLAHEEYDNAIVFVNSRALADKLSGDLIRNKRRVGLLHGEVDQARRNRVMALIQEGKINVLVATDLAARGLDIEGVGLVVNFEIARRGDDYVHRIGRTGRAGKQGLAITLVKSTEWNLKASIERYLKHQFEPRVIEELKGTYTGPKKLRASGQAAGNKKKKDKNKNKAASKKTKQRKRNKKNVGKRRSSPGSAKE